MLEQVVRDAADAVKAESAPRRTSKGLAPAPNKIFCRETLQCKVLVIGKPDETDFHVAIIMDGNGRWATRRGLPRTAGHRAGVETVRRIVEAAPDLGITTLTLFAFSSDNWRRPRRRGRRR